MNIIIVGVVAQRKTRAQITQNTTEDWIGEPARGRNKKKRYCRVGKKQGR